MNFERKSLWKSCLLVTSLCSLIPVNAFGEGYGSVRGQLVLEGDIPQRRLLVTKGDAQAKDPTVCAAQDLFSDELVVDSETKGIAHIFIYIYPTDFKRKKLSIHPDLKESKQKTLVFDQKGCRFYPHAMLVRTDQTVIVKSGDNCAHNTHTITISNSSVNFIVSPNDREGVEVRNRISERFPSQVKCDIHPWMKAWWLILDHPYAAVTDKDGKFKIEKLPAGEITFRVWHEKSGWINAGTKRGFEVSIEPDKTIDLGTIQVPVAKLTED